MRQKTTRYDDVGTVWRRTAPVAMDQPLAFFAFFPWKGFIMASDAAFIEFVVDPMSTAGRMAARAQLTRKQEEPVDGVLPM